MDNNKDLFNEITDFLNSEKSEPKGVLEDEEVEIIILSVLAANNGVASEDDLVKCVEWAEMTRLNETILGLVLKGFANINWKNGEPVFSLSDIGKSISGGSNNTNTH